LLVSSAMLAFGAILVKLGGTTRKAITIGIIA
jgi:hypothetical protein